MHRSAHSRRTLTASRTATAASNREVRNNRWRQSCMEEVGMGGDSGYRRGRRSQEAMPGRGAAAAILGFSIVIRPCPAMRRALSAAFLRLSGLLQPPHLPTLPPPQLSHSLAARHLRHLSACTIGELTCWDWRVTTACNPVLLIKTGASLCCCILSHKALDCPPTHPHLLGHKRTDALPPTHMIVGPTRNTFAALQICQHAQTQTQARQGLATRRATCPTCVQS